MVTFEDVQALAVALPRTEEAVVRGRFKFRVGRIVYLAFSSDETLMGFAFPKEERDALIASEPHKFMMPKQSDQRYNWVVVRLATIDRDEMTEIVLDAWRMVVPKRVAAAYAARFCQHGVTREPARWGYHVVGARSESVVRSVGDVVPDIADWEETYRTHAPRLMRMAAVLVGPADAGNLVTDAVLRAVRSRRWAEIDNRGAFLTAVLVNEARRVARTDQRRIEREQRDAVRLEHRDADPWTELAPIIASLSMRQRGVVYFAYWEDLSIPQIAAAMNISEGAVRRHLDRAKRHLRERIHDGHD